MRPATAELAAVAWLKSLNGLGDGMVATQLPKDQDTWTATGFVVVAADVGGAQNGYVPWRQSVLQLETYGVNPRTLNPDWATANYLAELIVAAATGNENLGVELATRDGYAPIRVTDASPATAPNRAETDPSSYALYRTDLALNWVQSIDT
jgi:hypothetical protein